MKMCALNIFLLTVFVGVTLASRTEDPLCVSMECPSDKPCRVLTECSSTGPCTLRAECLDNPPKFSHTGVCQVGQPILTLRNGSWEDTYCYPALPCPDGTYCNTELMDTYATCCRSDPTNTIKPGQCPTFKSTDTFYCVDTCQRDGDCRYEDKCCETGCRRECIAARNATACQDKTCPEGTYCLTPAEPRCTNSGVCHNDGDCVSCPFKQICRKHCSNGFQRDLRGCPICKCKRRPKNSQTKQ